MKRGGSKSERAWEVKRATRQLSVRARRRRERGLAKVYVERAKNWHWTRRERYRRELAGKAPAGSA